MCSEVFKRAIHFSFIAITNMADLAATLMTYHHGEFPKLYALPKPWNWVFILMTREENNWNVYQHEQLNPRPKHNWSKWKTK